MPIVDFRMLGSCAQCITRSRRIEDPAAPLQELGDAVDMTEPKPSDDECATCHSLVKDTLSCCRVFVGMHNNVG